MRIPILVLLLALPAIPTAQAPDTIIIDGEKLWLFANPLEPFLQSLKRRPSLFLTPYVTSSANWRGYIANWTIRNGNLYLTGIESYECPVPSGRNPPNNCKPVTLQSLFSKQDTKEGVHATWYTGELRIPKGKRLHYVHMGYASVYEEEIVLEMEKGKLIGRKKIDNRSKQRPPSLELEREELERTRNESKKP